MELDFACFASRARWEGGLLNLEGMGFATYEVEAYPARLEAYLVLAVTAAAWEAALPHKVEVYGYDDEGEQIALGLAIEVSFPPGVRHYLRAVDLREHNLYRDGHCVFEVKLDGQLAKAVELTVRKARALEMGRQRRAVKVWG